MIKFNENGTSNIVYCILNNLDECDSLMSKDVAINTTDFLIREIIGYGHDVFISTDETLMLTEASKQDKYTHAVIVATGTYLWAGAKLLTEVEKLCKQDFFVAGHVLNRGYFYLELHNQFYIMNLKTYSELGCPVVEKGQWFVDDEHEEYIPVITEFKDIHEEVIQSMYNSTEKKVYKSKLHGYNILKLALENNLKTIDVGTSIRLAKRYLYHEYEHVFVNEYPKVFHLQLLCRNIVSHWNSDKVHTDIPFEGPVEQYISVGTGLNWIRNLVMVGYTKDTSVVFTDINYNCLLFMQKLVEEWDGVDYNKFYHSYKQYFPNGIPEHVFTSLSATKEFEEFKQFFDDWDSTWAEMRQLRFDYKLIDYTSDYDLSWIEPNKKTLINLSDLFNHHPLVHFQSVKYRIAAENRLIQKFKDIDSEMTVILYSRAASGFKQFNDLYVSKSLAFIGKVKDIELTNIDDLKKLPWHENDWVTKGRRPLGL